ncbi:MAG: hypothetical protein IJV54_12335 [Bacteroidales bacterium]|nr:hypothetical protein [Bacteroidales bacterium]MBQ9713064.1 hypothetical protein [Bacteroidales bacterium]
MKSPKLFLISLLVAAFPLLSSAQILKKASQRTEIASVESETTGDWVSVQSVLRMEDDGSYWLSLGHAGIGSDILQIEFDPVTELFISLGNSLDEAIETMKEIQALYKEPRLSTSLVQGCLTAISPDKESLEEVTVTSRKLLTSRLLSFSVERGEMVRSASISKSEFGSLLVSLKLYKKLHPKEL